MTENVRKRVPRYTSTKKVYLNAATAVLSIIMALALLRDPLSVVYYVICTSILALIAFAMKIQWANVTLAQPAEGSSLNHESAPRKRWTALFFFVVLAIIASPFLLAGFLPATIWFIVIVGLASGISISELTFFIYCRRMVSQNG